MALGRAFSVAVRGLDGVIVEIEAHITSGLPGVHLVGLPDTALQESRDRVRAAITNCGNEWPQARLTLALSPATLPKMGSVYDLALATSVLSAQLKRPWAQLEKTLLLGELALDGRVRPVKGVLPAVLAAKREGWQTVVVPTDNLAEACLVDGIEVCGASTLGQLKAWLAGKGPLAGRVAATASAPSPTPELADVVGQSDARYAVEVAAAGAHHLMLAGPPGIGKTMLAQRLPSLLPELTPEQSLEVTAIHSVAGLLSGSSPLITRPPFIAPHHTSSVASLVGGGSGMARPGAVSRAHRGVLFLDECAEIGASALEALRTPLEDGEIRLGASRWCGVLPGPVSAGACRQPLPMRPGRSPRLHLSGQRQAALSRQVVRPPARPRRLEGADASSPLGGIHRRRRARPRRRFVSGLPAARDAAAERWAPHGVRTNAEIGGPLLRRRFRPPPSVMKPLQTALDRGALSIRGVDRTLRVAWSLADLGWPVVAGTGRRDDCAEHSGWPVTRDERRRAPRLGLSLPGRRAALR